MSVQVCGGLWLRRLPGARWLFRCRFVFAPEVSIHTQSHRCPSACLDPANVDLNEALSLDERHVPVTSRRLHLCRSREPAVNLFEPYAHCLVQRGGNTHERHFRSEHLVLAPNLGLSPIAHAPSTRDNFPTTTFAVPIRNTLSSSTRSSHATCSHNQAKEGTHTRRGATVPLKIMQRRNRSRFHRCWPPTSARQGIGSVSSAWHFHSTTAA